MNDRDDTRFDATRRNVLRAGVAGAVSGGASILLPEPHGLIVPAGMDGVPDVANYPILAVEPFHN